MSAEGATIRIGASACLLGQEVRYDGGHKHDALLTSLFGPYVTFVPICPEVEMGMGTPREAVRLLRDGPDGGVRMVGVQSGRDHTQTAVLYAREKADAIDALDLAGYVLKKDSPSCGMERVRVYDAAGVPSRTGVGLFARALLARHPLLPVEEEGRLRDADLRENFIVRVFAYRRLRDLFAGTWRIADLVASHSREKFLLLAHQPSAYAEAGRIVAHAKERAREAVAEAYATVVMGALARPASRGQQVNVLQHMLGFFSKQLDPVAREDLLQVIEDYGAGGAPLAAPVTLIRHYARVHDVGYLRDQVYLRPHPHEWLLRAHS